MSRRTGNNYSGARFAFAARRASARRAATPEGFRRKADLELHLADKHGIAAGHDRRWSPAMWELRAIHTDEHLQAARAALDTAEPDV